MAEEQGAQPEIQGQPMEEPKGGKTKATVAAAVIIVALVAVAVYAQQGGFGGGVSEEQSTPMEEEIVGEEATESGEEAMAEESTGGTVIDDGAGFAVDAPEGQAQSFDLTAKNFEFSLKEIRVKKGDTVAINVTSAEGFHDWTVDAFDAATERVNAGQSSSVVFVADQAGEFEYYCSVGSHRSLGMVGMLIVEE
ncbi:MAG: cupredoxin domain-containing protein [Parcubacteria group bacterium]|nr:cupredoxin domain-containing protein [Parcubacteria group bacterium]